VPTKGKLQIVKYRSLQPIREEFMSTTVEAVIDKDGVVRLLEHVPLAGFRRALVIILDEEPAGPPNETALRSQAALAEDWSRPEEDAAWSTRSPT
jgi:hypothetical protein